jgi:signal transduction histidine kinase
VKQQLFVIQTAAATAQARFDDDRAGAAEALGQVRAAAREATTEMEALLDELQAAPLENTGLLEAVKKQCEALAFRTGAEVTFQPGVLPPAGSLRQGAHEAIYRVAQEALANVARHARARRVNVSMATTATRFTLRIIDDGAGIDPGAARSGMGIAKMESRAMEIGGRVTMTPVSPGTEMQLSVPLTHPELIKAWFNAALFALLAISFMVFYGLRGNSSDRRISLVSVGLFGVFSAVRLATVYLKLRRENLR